MPLTLSELIIIVPLMAVGLIVLPPVVTACSVEATIVPLSSVRDLTLSERIGVLPEASIVNDLNALFKTTLEKLEPLAPKVAPAYSGAISMAILLMSIENEVKSSTAFAGFVKIYLSSALVKLP